MLCYNDTKVILQHVGHTMISNQGIIDFTGMETFAKEICGVLTETKKIIGLLERTKPSTYCVLGVLLRDNLLMGAFR